MFIEFSEKRERVDEQRPKVYFSKWIDIGIDPYFVEVIEMGEFVKVRVDNTRASYHIKYEKIFPMKDLRKAIKLAKDFTSGQIVHHSDVKRYGFKKYDRRGFPLD